MTDVRRAVRDLVAATFTVAALAACEPAPTRIVVVVGSDLELPREIDELRIEVDATPIGGVVRLRTAALDASSVLPIVLVVHHDGGPLGPISVLAVGRRGGVDVLSRAASLSFDAGRSAVLRLDLMRSCLVRVCGGGDTCVENTCVSTSVDVATLPSWTGRGDAPSASDAGTPMDGGAMSCASGCACEQTCGSDGRCECLAGCACDLSCSAGDDCTTPRCDGAGTVCEVDGAGTSNFDFMCDHLASCVVDARGASNATSMECRHGATCDVDCTDVSNCRLSCDPESPCLLRCGSADGCELDCEARQTCADGTQVCNRDCP